MNRRPDQDPERIKALILRICLVVWLLACIAMGALAYVRHNHPDSPWARWQAAAERAVAAHQAQLLQNQRQEADRLYIAHVQAVCGPETWWVADQHGALVCTTKRGRPTGHVLVEAQP